MAKASLGVWSFIALEHSILMLIHCKVDHVHVLVHLQAVAHSNTTTATIATVESSLLPTQSTEEIRDVLALT